jgi:phospholipase C
LFVSVGLAALCACGGGGGSSSAPPVVAPSSTPVRVPTPVPTPIPSAGPAGKILHIVVIIQENRSFDNLFNGFPNADSVKSGVMVQPGAAPTTVPLAQVPLAVPCDLSHSHIAWAGDWDGGRMDGFSESTAGITCPKGAARPPATYAYSYVNPSDVAQYWQLAHNYTLMDEVFEEPTAPSFESHQHLIAGQSNNTSENPRLNGVEQSIWGCDSPAGTTVALYNGLGDTLPGIPPCFAPPYATVADLLDAKKLPWKYYAPSIGAKGNIWSAFDAVQSIRYGPDWNADVISPETTILTQAKSLPSVAYVVPSYANSDHASSDSATGPAWVAAVVNAIGASPDWSTTAIFVLWDDWGGWYDHVAPAVSANYTVGGFRVPVLCISPYSEDQTPASPSVDHNVHGTDGILSFIEETFGLASLNQQDAHEAPFNDCFNFTTAPKPFIPAPASALYPASYFVHQRPSGIVPDDDK